MGRKALQIKLPRIANSKSVLGEVTLLLGPLDEAERIFLLLEAMILGLYTSLPGIVD
jgi:hypothetical protein